MPDNFSFNYPTFPLTSAPRRRNILRNPRFLALLTILLTLIRHRDPLRAQLQSLISTIRRAINAIRFASTILHTLSFDTLTYLAPTPRRLRRRARLIHPPAPPSLRRLLRLAASDDGLSIIHNVAGGAARGVTRQLTSANSAGSGVSVREVIDCLASANGQKVVSNVVGTAVREGVGCVMALQRKGRERTDKSDKVDLAERVIEGVLSEPGRRLVVDVVGTVTKAVVPAVMNAPPAQELRDARASSCMPPMGSVRAISPMASPMSKRPRSWRCDSPVTRQLVMGVMQAQGRSGLVERLALLAIRDKALVREVVRVVVTEGIKTYFNTMAEIRERGNGVAASCEERDGGKEDEVSLWKVLLKSAVIDIKKALLKRGEKGATGWLMF